MTRSTQQIVEEQVARWRLERRQQQLEGERKTGEYVPANVVAICNAYGSNASLIIAKVGQQLNLPVYDREIVAHIATTTRVRLETVETLDERAQSRLDDYLTSLLHEKNFDQNDYFQALTRTITALWGHGPCVFMGHGASHIVRRENVLSVRITAPSSQRLRRVQDLEHIDREQARRRLEKVDAEREAFVRRFFHAQIDDPLLYDLVMNTGALDTDICAKVIADTYRMKFSRARVW